MIKIKGIYRRHKNIITLVLFLFISGLLIIFAPTGVVMALNKSVSSIFSIFQTSFMSVVKWSSDMVNSVGKVDELRKELSLTRNELMEYQRISRDIVHLRKENRELKNELKLAKGITYSYIPAEVVSWNSEHLFSSLMINKGSLDGIKKDMSVIAFQGGLQGLVGKVISVNINSAVVLTLVDPSSYVSGRFQDSDYVGLIEGRGINSDYLMMNGVKKHAAQEIQYGDIIETSGLGGLYPKGIAVGRYRKMQAKEYETTLKLEVQPVIDFTKLEYVYVLQGNE
ncbi:MAG: rod shape-determining protein MreC [Spirochaetia bacterium]